MHSNEMEFQDCINSPFRQNPLEDQFIPVSNETGCHYNANEMGFEDLFNDQLLQDPVEIRFPSIEVQGQYIKDPCSF